MLIEHRIILGVLVLMTIFAAGIVLSLIWPKSKKEVKNKEPKWKPHHW